MIRLCLLLALALSAAPLLAQEDEKEIPASAEIPADFTDYIKRVFPTLDPMGEHDLFDLKNPTDADELHDYTGQMARLVLLYINQLEMGATLSKLFDQYSRGRYAEYPAFKVMHAILLLQYPPGRRDAVEAEKLLREVAAQHADFAYPWYYLAQVAQLSAANQQDRGAAERLRRIDRALEIRADFIQARVVKAEILVSTNRNLEAVKLIEPMVKGKLPQDPDDYADLIRWYAIAAGTASLHAVVDEHLAREDLPRGFRVRALHLKARTYMLELRFDDAIGTLQKALEITDPKREPEAHIRILTDTGECWSGKAVAMQRDEPSKREEAAKLLDEALSFLRQAAEAERVNLPVAMRGIYAERYLLYLWKGAGKKEAAVNWVTSYLKETDLTAARRAALSSRLQEILLEVNPTEQGRVSLLESYVKQDDMPKLESALATARQNVRTQREKFSTERALTLFTQLLRSPVRKIVADAAFLSSDAALAIGGDAPARAAAAIASRFEEEKECNSDQQAELQLELSNALARLDHKPSWERVVRHFASLVDEASSFGPFPRVMHVWNEPEFLSRLKHAPQRFARSRNNTAAAKWLRELADAIRKELDEESGDEGGEGTEDQE